MTDHATRRDDDTVVTMSPMPPWANTYHGTEPQPFDPREPTVPVRRPEPLPLSYLQRRTPAVGYTTGVHADLDSARVLKRHRAPRHARVAVLSMLAALLGGGVVIALLGYTGVMNVPLPGFPDSGVNACKVLAGPKQATAIGNGQPAPEPSATPRTEAEVIKRFAKLREMFADSRHEDLRRTGVQLIDVTVQIIRYPKGAFALVSTFSSAYVSAAGACGAHGVPLPALGE